MFVDDASEKVALPGKRVLEFRESDVSGERCGDQS
jgi:hypothetical protein